ncbi:MAG: DNA methylase [Desulfuromonadales bacterium C00003107]|nr:MAG: DNA methylase [Desulfuromonadales bacterium C00003107]
MARKKRVDKTTPVESVKHKDKRANIPTEELRDFVKEDENQPKTVLYPRDPSLDPQLVWKGKDEQDQQDLAVPSVPIYIQEKIHPQTIIEDVRRTVRKEIPAQFTLFADFNGLEFEEMIDFYRHGANWSNRMILGDSLYVMTSLAEKEGLKGQVQMIYIDPPYGIKFGSNWQVSTRQRNVSDGKVEDVTRQPEQIRAFRDTWKLGIHSYLAYLRDRLIIARELLTGSGSIFVQIGDENIHLVRCLMDEVFGSENFCQLVPFRKKLMPLGAKLLEGMYDYLIWYAKDLDSVKFKHLFKKAEPRATSRWTNVELPDGTKRKLTKEETENTSLLPGDSRIYRLVSQRAPSYSAANVYDIDFWGHNYSPPRGGCWVTSKEKMERLFAAERLESEGDNLSYIYYHDDYPYSKINNVWSDTSPVQNKSYVVQTTELVLTRCVLMTTDPGDMILDPTCGSGTTAYVAEQWGRRWITTDTSRVALALARTRLMAAKYPYYYLADSPEGIRKEAEITGKMPPEYKTENDIKKGFVYKRVSHITLKSIANNPEIDTIHARWQKKTEPIRTKLNGLLKKSWEEWEIPREVDKEWPKEAKKLHQEWWELRKNRQEETDKSIARDADQETLYDQPYEDRKRIRVAGPFTVESLSPHRVLSTDDEIPASEKEGRESTGAGQFEIMILENLKKAGVQNTIKNERLHFDRLETYAGTWIHAEGEYTEKDGTVRRVAVCIGPEHGTVGPELVKEAAKEAVKGVGFDVLIICGFAFDPHVSEEAKRYGQLTVLPARMNADLSMGDELLKKTGAGNLFMIFGEPDLKIEKTKSGQITVEVKGVDVYDPTTGQIRSHSTDDIACWFIDTAYNEESFFVRHAYFTGADRPYDKLKRALRAEIDEAAWSSLYTTKSRPFDPPNTGKIAVKVINHYGDEVLKVYEI